MPGKLVPPIEAPEIERFAIPSSNCRREASADVGQRLDTTRLDRRKRNSQGKLSPSMLLPAKDSLVIASNETFGCGNGVEKQLTRNRDVTPKWYNMMADQCNTKETGKKKMMVVRWCVERQASRV